MIKKRAIIINPFEINDKNCEARMCELFNSVSGEKRSFDQHTKVRSKMRV